MKITIVGLGLIGGSMGIDLQKNGLAQKVYGVDKSEDNQLKALELGLVNEIVDLSLGIKLADVVLLAVPVDALTQLLPLVLDQTDNQTIIDLGSTKLPIVNAVLNHPKRKNFVAAHPMAGTEFSGPEAAFSGLFYQQKCYIIDAEKSSEISVQKAKRIFQSLYMELRFLDAQSHDIHAAYVSHISHLTSFSLALAVLDKEQDEKQILNMAAGGFSSTVRLANSSADMWSPIFIQNAQNLTEVIDSYIINMQKFRDSIINNDHTALKKLITKANQIAAVLHKKQTQPLTKPE